MSEEGPRILIIAGPNGAGKTTFAREFLPNEANCPVFVNADLIAARLSPGNPERAAIEAGRLMLQEIERLVLSRQDFAFETTLSGLTYLKRITHWRKTGYEVKLVFLSLPYIETAIRRVAARVLQGGHNIPELVIRRRFESGLHNFHSLYKPLVDAWALYNNAGEKPDLLEESK